MKKIITLISILMSTTPVFANGFPQDELKHMDLVDLLNIKESYEFHVNYPGISGIADCLAMIIPKMVSDKDLQELQKYILVTNGDGILFPPTHRRSTGRRNITTAESVIVTLPSGVKQLRFKISDRSVYITGVKIAAYSPYISLKQILEPTLGKLKRPVMMQFLRGCQI